MPLSRINKVIEEIAACYDKLSQSAETVRRLLTEI